MVTYRVIRPASSTADPLTKGLALCDPGDVMTGMGFLTSGEARASAPEPGGESVEGSACTADIPDDTGGVPEGGLPLCPLIGYVTCVDLAPFHEKGDGAGRRDTETSATAVDTESGSGDSANTDTGGFDPPSADSASIRLSPEVGPAGFTTTVKGTGFIPGSHLNLSWDRGVDRRSIPVTVRSDGSFTAQILIMPNDLLGTRTMIVGMADNPNAYPDVLARYLVVPGTSMPPSSDGDGFVFRR